MQKQHTGEPGLPQVQHTFLELPKYAAGDDPVSLVDKWAYFFREANGLNLVPPALAHHALHMQERDLRTPPKAKVRRVADVLPAPKRHLRALGLRVSFLGGLRRVVDEQAPDLSSGTRMINLSCHIGFSLLRFRRDCRT
jgi:hypothetical protein